MIPLAGIFFVLALICIAFDAVVVAALFAGMCFLLCLWLFIALLPILLMVVVPILIVYLIIKVFK
jgi:hypothetical protein